ncbi:hypothetical protein EOS93_24865 [Rhizobium sp. RMa-01]|nr:MULTISPECIES: hypothetical protein [unclassified Rhizobium]OHV25001.1 hypothetical protein BBJ66_22965 [Rhizobium sp. RSm-3]RVU08291.1 hypothetical protein EOS93_24865 [Rhizobium sp. RMa-01]
MPMSEGYALKYFVLYTLLCMMVGIVLLAIVQQVAPFKMGTRSDQPGWSATGASEQADDLVVGSTPGPATHPPAVRPPAQWDLRPTNQPTVGPSDQSGVRKGGRVGTPAQ